jgi:predicted aspartyl protease
MKKTGRQNAQKVALGLALVTLTVTIFGCAGLRQSKGGADQAAVPLLIVKNRPFVNVMLQGPDGSSRSARFLVDSGGGAFIITEPVAHDLGLQWGNVQHAQGQDYGQPEIPPKAFVGNVPLDLEPSRVLVAIGTDSLLAPAVSGHADGMLPGYVLARYHVVFDYPNATFTLARPGVLKPIGNALPMPVSRGMNFPRTEIEVDGVIYGFLLDTGASFTMVSEVLLKTWGQKHQDWPRYRGAVGEARTLGGQTLETMFVPAARWGPYELSELGVTSQMEGTFEKWMSGMMSAPIVGSLAGNVLKDFRVELDYQNETLYLSKP